MSAPEPPSDDLAGLDAEGLLSAGLDGDGPSVAEIASHFPNYEILGVLGEGGMGVVYKARHLGLDRLVALKLLPPDVDQRAGFSERFAREARSLARLEHANIVRVYDFGESDGLFFLALEYVDGATLRELMRDGDMAPREALAIVPQLCDALQYAHDVGIVHRDIKPENVLVTKDGVVKLTDFGLAKLVDPDAVDHTLTRQGQVMGTLHYMAPEQLETPNDVDHRADIYSLGVVFYEMLTGELPIGRFEAPSQRVSVDVRLDRVVLRALEKRRERRYQRAVEVRTAVDGLENAGPPQREQPPVPETRRRTSRTAILGALCLALALAMTIGTMVHANYTLQAVGWLGTGSYVAATVAKSLGVIGVVLCIVAWWQTARSGGALRGVRLAMAGVLLPIVVVPLLSFAHEVFVEGPSWARMYETTTSVSVSGGVAAFTGEEQLVSDIEALWERGVDHAVSGRGREGIERLYAIEDAERLAALTEEQFRVLAENERVGAPLSAHVAEHGLGMRFVQHVDLTPDRMRAEVRCKGGKHGVSFQVQYTEDGWRFAAGPVSRSTVLNSR